ncbi:site-specific integrase [Flagellimonas taeanensis]|uniref:site-specific integrase n=1 Tax=Flavobacteriaceae TaxID=49546 RepID=UPI000E684DD0|nr:MULTISPECIES: site-specific integrase [Allomuricauda]MDC6385817.1 site-specific integrase [Muricauda sp. SK9]RIV50907.1 site-specific integrase [Allomuricauda taeanensis]
MKESFAILFYTRKSRSNNDQRASIYLRITVGTKRAEISVQRKVNPNQWNQDAGKVKGSGQFAIDTNKHLDEIRHRLYDIHSKMISKGKTITANAIRDGFLGKGKSEKMLIALYREHNEQILELVGQEYSKGRYYQHNRTMKHLKKFLYKEYGLEDIPIKKVDLSFIQRFEHHLRVTKAGGRNTVTKYITNFKKIVRIAHAHNWINKDPFFHWKAQWKFTDREVLTESELNALLEKEFTNKKLERARDVFLFCCFTGLSYADVKKLTEDDIVMDIKGQHWIKTERKKTKTKSSVPLLPIPIAIMEKYAASHTQKTGYILPVVSNQKLNDYLKDIAEICGIKKKVTFHLSRHTFATTVTLANGVPIESVSKMLGHTNIKTTQIYAKVVDRKLAEDMDIVLSKYRIG